MKKSIKILTIVVVLILINILSMKIVYGAVAFKDTGTVLTNHTISEFYDMAKDIKVALGSLAGTSVDVHMANNREWATVSYFSNSNYGTRGEGKNTGVTVGSHLSTNGNITGVMDWGKTTTFTAGIISNRPTEGDLYTNGKSLVDNAEINSQIDNVTNLSAMQVGRTGWYSSRNRIGNDVTVNPYSVRDGLFGFGAGTYRK